MEPNMYPEPSPRMDIEPNNQGMNDQHDREISEQLLEKIRSKMDVGKFFAGFISLFLGIAFKDLSTLATDSNRSISYPVRGGFLCILGALVFSVATIFAYDRLLMPPEFWRNRPTTSSFNQVLYREMVRAWSCLFVPAVVSFFVGLLGFLIAVLKQPLTAVQLWLIPIIASFLVYRFYSNMGRDVND